jgi:hypothetical protein
LRRVGFFHSESELFFGKLPNDPVDDLLLTLRSCSFRLSDERHRIPVELGVERQPAHPYRIDLHVHGMPVSQGYHFFGRLVIAPLIAMDVVK